jgi:hypothetical protein
VAVFGYATIKRSKHPDRKLTSRPRSRIRHCLVCGIAMQASKSREDLPQFDTFECLSCKSMIRETKPPPADDGPNAR